MRKTLVLTACLWSVGGDMVYAEAAPLRTRAAAALRSSAEFFRSEVATEGGYLWRYSEDLATREGEGKASASMVWVQPPGTPSVGVAFLEAYEATGDAYYLDAARQAGYCLVRGQLRSGGWDYRIEFDPPRRKRYAYRVDPQPEEGSQRNTSTLDDNTTQAALRLLMRLDKTLDFEDAQIHQTARSALQSLLEAQYPNGAWPQRFDRFPRPEDYPICKARYPQSWSRKHPQRSYAANYTFNDSAIADVIDVMFEASRTYGDGQYAAAAGQAGQFILQAQMPEPQPAWAQQYDAQMQPSWARKFEPPSITGGESQGVLRTLLQLYRETGNRQYLEPIPRAIEYLRQSQLPDGRLARFYELKTNRPLYFTKDYKLTYSDEDMPTHYAFKVGNGLEAIQRQYEQLRNLDGEQLRRRSTAGLPRRVTSRLAAEVERVIAALDDEGRWVEDGRLKYHGADDPTRRVIDCRTFVANVRTLSTFLTTFRD